MKRRRKPTINDLGRKLAIPVFLVCIAFLIAFTLLGAFRWPTL
jgi:hypothetical protein